MKKTLIWKPLAREHIDVIFQANKGNVTEYFYDFQNKAEAEAWVIDAIIQQESGQKPEYVIFDGDDFVGMISPSYPEANVAEIGLWLCVEKQGQGYGHLILSELLVRLAVQGITQVIYTANENNLPSRRLAESLGFVGKKKGDKVEFTKYLS